MKILIAEDDTVTRRMLQKTLEKWGHEVTAARNGDQALEIYQRGGHHLVLTDWMMPGMKGPEFCRRMKETSLRSGIDPYIILLTSRDTPQDLQEGLDAGASEYIKKPYEQIELHARVKVGLRILEMQQELHRLASTDQLTSLLNRRELVKLLRRDEDRMRRENRPMGILMADVDHFKSVNDQYGHDLGDKVLVRVAQSMEASVRGGDYVGRWGGEEFLVVLPGADVIQSAEVAERCRNALEQQRLRTPEGGTLGVTASLGAASTEGANRCDVMELVQQADKALYWAKESGRNRVKIYVPSADRPRR